MSPAQFIILCIVSFFSNIAFRYLISSNFKTKTYRIETYFEKLNCIILQNKKILEHLDNMNKVVSEAEDKQKEFKDINDFIKEFIEECED